MYRGNRKIVAIAFKSKTQTGAKDTKDAPNNKRHSQPARQLLGTPDRRPPDHRLTRFR
jgi:hypothetical protein